MKRAGNVADVIASANSRLESHQTILEYALWEEDDFPRTRSLKKDRRAVHIWAMRRLGLDADRSEAGDPVNSDEGAENTSTAADKLIRILSGICGVEEASVNEKSKLVFDLDLDSLKRVALVSVIEEEFGVEIPEENIDEKTTVGDLRTFLEESPKTTAVPTHISWPNKKIVVESREFLRQLFFPFTRILEPSRIEVRGREHIEKMKLPAMMIFNHVGHNEPLLIIRSLPSRIRKEQVTLADPRSFRNWWRAFFMYFWGSAFPIAKFGGPIRHTLELASDLLDRGKLLFYSPEGARSETGEIGEFKKGAAVLAVETGVPVYPVKVDGYRDVYPIPGKNFDIPRKRGTVTLTFGAPIRFEKGMSYESATLQMRNVLESL
jgi:acyl carrier protein